MMFSAKRALSLLLVFLLLFSSAAYAADEELVDSAEEEEEIIESVEEEVEESVEEETEGSPEELTEFQKLKTRFDNYCEAPYGEFEIVLKDDLEFEETLEIPDNATVTVRPDDNVWDSVSLIHHKDNSPMFELKGANSVLTVSGRDNCSIVFRIPDMEEENIGSSLRGIENNGRIALESVSFVGFGNEENGIRNSGYAVVNNENANASFLDIVADSNSVFNSGVITIEEDDTDTLDGCFLNSGSGFVRRDGEPEEEPEATVEELEENVEESENTVGEPEVVVEEFEENEESDSAFPAGEPLEQIPVELFSVASAPQVYDAGQSVDEEIETVIQNQYEEVSGQTQQNWPTSQTQQETQYQQNSDYQDYSQKQAITVYASWNDNGNSAYRRPASTQINLYSNGSLYLNATLSSANNWTHTFVNLPIGPSYRIEETGIADYSTYYETSGNNVYIRNSYTGTQPSAQYTYQPQQTQQPAINYYSTQSTTYTAPPVRTSAPAATPVPTAVPTAVPTGTPVPTFAPASASPVPSPTPYSNPDDTETESGTSSHAWIWVAVFAVSGAAAAGILVYLNSMKKQREAEARARERARKRAQMEAEQRSRQTAQRRPQASNEQRRQQPSQRRPQTEEERSMQADIAAGVRRTREDAARRRSASQEANSEYKPRH